MVVLIVDSPSFYGHHGRSGGTLTKRTGDNAEESVSTSFLRQLIKSELLLRFFHLKGQFSPYHHERYLGSDNAFSRLQLSKSISDRRVQTPGYK